MVPQAKNPIILLLLLCILSVGCSQRNSSLETVVVDNKVVPRMRTEGAINLVSDSGITRYRAKTSLYEIYVEGVPESYWYFPKGILVERFDSLFNIEASITADTAYNYYENQKLWKGIGNVKAVNLAGEKFETSELFWSEKDGSIYTDKFIRIEREGQIHTGYGFRSNSDMSEWQILKHAGIIDIKEDSIGTAQTTSVDTVVNIQPTPEKDIQAIKR